MWGFLYTGVFIAAFAASAVFKIKGNSLGKKYTPAWNDSVGKVYTDLVYGEGEANKFDPYVPAETGRETYARTASLPKTTAARTTIISVIIRFCVSVIFIS